MAKSWYKIPTSLDRSYLDHEIGLSGGGFSLKAMPLKQLFFYGGGLMIVLWSTTSTFINSAHGLLIAAWVVWAIAAVFYFGAMTRTKELRAMTIPAFLEYLPPTNRRVLTRRNSNASGLFSIVGINQINDDGRIHFSDGSEAHVYLVVGSASHLLFDEDREAILARVDAFWRKVDSGCEWIWMTTREPQRIHHQIASMERRNQSLIVRDPDLLDLQHEQFDILTEHVGGQFSSIHQYLILKGRSAESLRLGHQLLQAEVERSVLMIKEIVMLDRSETEQVLSIFYQGVRDKLGRRRDEQGGTA